MSDTEAAPAHAPDLPTLKLRDDLLLSYQSYGNRPCYLLEDPAHGSYFQIGLKEYRFIQCLDGEADLASALEKSNNELSEEEGKTLMQWLLQSQLVYVQHPEYHSWHLPPKTDDQLKKNAKKLNPLFLKFPLGNPDGLLERTYPWFAWMLGWGFFWLWLALSISAVYLLASHTERFAAAAMGLLSPYNGIWLILAWVLVKTIHEVFHGLVCKKYGGTIPEAGVFFILFAPLGGYVNAGSSWRFTSKWQRIHVSSAGMFIEVLLAALAVWIWVYTDTGALNFLAYNIIIIAGIGTLLFNANPLMRFDGYYILSDWLNLPNLGTAGQRYLQYLSRYYIQGRDMTLPAWAHPNWIKVYGILALFWRIFIMLSLIFLASHLLEGVGLLLAGLGIFSWLGVPILSFFVNIRKAPDRGRVLMRVGLITLTTSALLFALFTQWQWTYTVSAPAVLDYAGSTWVRNSTEGFVAKILVKNGQMVKQGDVLLRLNNRELHAELKNIDLQRQIHQAKQQQALDKNEPALYQVEQEKLKDLEGKWQQLSQQVADLSVYAQTSGQIIASNLDDLQDAYLAQGSVMMNIGDPEQLQAHISIAAADVDFFRTLQGQQIDLYLDRQALQLQNVALESVQPGASIDIRYPALTALAGGELMVIPRQDKQQGKEEDPYQFVEPRFWGLAHLPSELATQVYSGERGIVLIDSHEQTLWQRFRRWVNQTSLFKLPQVTQ